MKNNLHIRIGTRDSPLALAQAHIIKNHLLNLGYIPNIIPIKSLGDIDLKNSLYKMNTTGIFTKTLDKALINGDIDIAIHSLKDVPTLIDDNLWKIAVLERENPFDVLITKSNIDYTKKLTLATSSLRRKTQWLNKYPHHNIINIRGNIGRRLNTLNSMQNIDAIFLAQAGLDRLKLSPPFQKTIEWMIPAPAQGALAIISHKKNKTTFHPLKTLNDRKTELCTNIERIFLRTLEGGCSAPIGAYAHINKQRLHFKAIVLSHDAKKCVHISKSTSLNEDKNWGYKWAVECLENGGKEIMSLITLKNENENKGTVN